MTGERFRQIPLPLYLSLMAARLPGSVYQVLLVVIDQTLGFRREKALISLTQFQRLTGLSRQGVVDALRYAKERNIIASEKTRGKPTTYAINPPGTWALRELVNPALLDQSTGVYQTSQLPQSGGRLPIHSIIDNPIDNDARLIDKAGGGSLIKTVITDYLKAYQSFKGKPHPLLKPGQWRRVVAALTAFGNQEWEKDLEVWRDMIDWHFRRKLATDWNILHFATKGILENLGNKVSYASPPPRRPRLVDRVPSHYSPGDKI